MGLLLGLLIGGSLKRREPKLDPYGLAPAPLLNCYFNSFLIFVFFVSPDVGELVRNTSFLFLEITFLTFILFQNTITRIQKMIF